MATTGLRLAVEDGGEGPPLVLVHGLATTRAIWDAVTPRLRRTRRVVTLDLPGFGESAPVGPGFELEAVAERLAAGLREHRLSGPYDLVGHSLGAAVALTLAVRHPSDVERLVLAAPAGLLGLPPRIANLLALGVDGFLAGRRRLAPMVRTAWGRRLLLAFAAADGARLTPRQARDMLEASAGARRTTEAFATIATADLRPLLRACGQPLGALWGTRDLTVPPQLAQALRDVRPDVRLAMVEGAGHVAMIERPEAFAVALEELLERLPKRATTFA